MKPVTRLLASALLLSALSGCYYPVYPASPPPVYGYAPVPQQGGPATGQECREYSKSSMIDGKTQQIVGHACRQPDGSWQDANSGSPVDLPPAPDNGAAQPVYAQPYPAAPQAYAPQAYAPQAYYPAPAYYAAPGYYPYYASPVVVEGGFYVGGGGYRRWR